MKVSLPNNIFCNLLLKSFNFFDDKEINYVNVSSIISEVENENCDLAIIPTLDLLNHLDLFVSSKLGISFSGLLSLAYFYFVPGQRSINNLFLKGDISKNEIILSNFLFKERFNTNVEIKLDTEEIEILEKNYLFIGDMNFTDEYLGKGLSLADELVDQIGLPYVNFVIVSKNEKSIQELNKSILNSDIVNEDYLKDVLSRFKINSELNSFLTENISSISFLLADDDIEGINEVLHLPYYHGMIDDITEIKLR